MTAAPPGRLLDGFLLLTVASSRLPEQVVRAKLVGLHITDVASDDLSFFSHLHYLDVSENPGLPLDKLAALPALGDLEAACLSLPTLPSPLGLTSVERLDLSFNQLSGEALLQLSALPHLRYISLAHNLVAAVPSVLPPGSFPALRQLSLNGNRLSDLAKWRGLGSIPQLMDLSLAENGIHDVHTNDPIDEFTFPLLRSLDLSNNCISTPISLAALAGLPSLRQVILTGNPVLTEKRVNKGQSAGNLCLNRQTGRLGPVQQAHPASRPVSPRVRLPLLRSTCSLALEDLQVPEGNGHAARPVPLPLGLADGRPWGTQSAPAASRPRTRERLALVGPSPGDTCAPSAGAVKVIAQAARPGPYYLRRLCSTGAVDCPTDWCPRMNANRLGVSVGRATSPQAAARRRHAVPYELGRSRPRSLRPGLGQYGYRREQIVRVDTTLRPVNKQLALVGSW